MCIRDSTYNDPFRVSLEIKPDGGYTRYEYDDQGRTCLLYTSRNILEIPLTLEIPSQGAVANRFRNGMVGKSGLPVCLSLIHI